MAEAREAEQRLAGLRRRWEVEHASGAFLPLAEEYRRLGRLEEAIALLEAGLKAQPSYLSAQVALGRCRLDSGDAAGAAGVLERAIRQDPTQMVANKLLVEAYLRTGRPLLARERLDLYAVLNDRDPEIALLDRRISALAAAPAAGSGLESEPTVPSEPTAPAHPPHPPHPAHPDTPPLAQTAVPQPTVATAPPDIAAARAARQTQVPLGGTIFALPTPALPAPDLQRLEPRLEARARHAEGGDPHSEPFLGLGGARAKQRYLEGLAAEGIFRLAEAGAVTSGSRAEAIADEAGIAPAPSEPPATFAPELRRPWPALDTPRGAAQRSADDLERPRGEASATPENEWPEPPPALALPVHRPLVPPEPSRAAPASLLGPRPAGGAPTATLGELYLRQGHYAEAAQIFLGVLGEEPENLQALAGLEEVRQRVRNAESPASPLSFPAGEGLTARKARTLRDYLGRLRRGQPHVS